MPSENTEHRKLAAIMFTDMVGYSALSQLNEALALELLHEHHQLLRGLLPRHQGHEIKSTGDGLLIEFASALAAVQCAVAIQRAMAERNQSEPPPRRVSIRIGVHLGDLVQRDGDVFGDGVNIAARIEPLADPGGICVSRAVFEQIENKVEHPFVQLSRPELKNIQAAVEVYKLVLDGVRCVQPASSSPRRHRAPALALGSLAVLVAVAIVLILKQGSPPQTSVVPANGPPASPAPANQNIPDERSVAVLPFANISADKDNEYLSDGITEDILNALAKVPNLRVPARTSAFVFKGRNEDVRKIGGLLQVATVLEGSVQRAGERLRITVKLSNAADGFQLWSEQFDRDMKDVFAIQDEITRAIVAKLKVTLPSPAAYTIQRSTKNIEAYQLYLKGRFLAQRYTAESVKQAITCFEQAVAKQPDYAQAHVALAYAYGELRYFGQSSSQDFYARMATVMERARQLDDTVPETYLFGANTSFYYRWNWAEAERLFKRAIELDVANPDAHTGYAMFLAAMGRFQEAAAENSIANKIDPLASSVKLNEGWIYLRAKVYDRALEIGRRLNATETNYHKVHELMGAALFRKDRRDEGLAEMETAVRLEGEPLASARLGRMYGQAGRVADAERMLARLQDLSKTAAVPAHCFAYVHEGLGDFEEANAWMTKAIAAREFPLVNLKVEADELSLVNPHFTEWLQKIGLEKK